LLPKKEVEPVEVPATGTAGGAEEEGLCLDEENKEKGLDLLTGVVWALEEGFVGEERR
jgi:hypothetical protein